MELLTIMTEKPISLKIKCFLFCWTRSQAYSLCSYDFTSLCRL